MEFIDLSYSSPAENLACDEALLDLREQHGGAGILRFWDSPDTFVVVGYANKIQAEVDMTRCEADKVPIFRRCSGGGTVLQGTDCLNYALILPIEQNSPLSEISGANKYIMDRNLEAIQSIAGDSLSIKVQGHTDLAAARGSSTVFRKFSGNSQRRHKAFLLFHGTFLLNFDLELVEKYLTFPSRQPDYRGCRSHTDFLMNLDLPPANVKDAIKKVWKAERPLQSPPLAAITELARSKYATDEWNLKFFHV
ncbi:MAG TPA: lipoate--protein ligase family protein [Verrucomicrobiae bacterium]|jgi:lipoate-protein ligase A|nr:lipoate--protein ligase family protein [Verrucomicrobiae bacterium]